MARRTTPATIYRSTMPSPRSARCCSAGTGTAITAIFMATRKHPEAIPSETRPDDGPFLEARRQLEAYFAGELREFALELAPEGTLFRLKVWRALLDIPYGATETYGALAERIGLPQAARAVGLANGRNPISIVIPCHRVIGKTGALVGYGGGLERANSGCSPTSSATPSAPSSACPGSDPHFRQIPAERLRPVGGKTPRRPGREQVHANPDPVCPAARQRCNNVQHAHFDRASLLRLSRLSREPPAPPGGLRHRSSDSLPGLVRAAGRRRGGLRARRRPCRDGSQCRSGGRLLRLRNGAG